VAEKLGNKPATCRKYYVHPCVIEAYTSGALPEVDTDGNAAETDAELSAEELCVLNLIKASARSKPSQAA